MREREGGREVREREEGKEMREREGYDGEGEEGDDEESYHVRNVVGLRWLGTRLVWWMICL